MDLSQWNAVLKGYMCIHGHDTEHVRAVELTELDDAIVACDRGHRWTITHPQPSTTSSRSGILADLGVYDALLDLFSGQPESFREYGVVEHHLAQSNPELYRHLVETYGHTTTHSSGHTASAILAGALGRLSAEGLVTYADGKATGRWAYNGNVSYWAPGGTPPQAPRITWEQFSNETGIDPGSWPATEWAG